MIRAYKPLDFGNGIVSGTLAPSGRWLSLGIAHEIHGRVVLTDAPVFPEASRRDQAAVRAYRAWLAAPDRAGFGLGFLSGGARAFLVEDVIPFVVQQLGELRLEVATFAPRGRRGAVQLVYVGSALDVELELRWTGTMRLARAAYPELTEGGPLQPAPENPRRGA